MIPQPSDWTAVVERLEKLERHNRKLKQMGAVVLVLAASVLLMGQAAPKKTVEANEFILKDENGRISGSWIIVDGSPQLSFFGQKGNVAVSLGESGVGPPKENRQLVMRYGGPFLTLYDADGNRRAWLGVDRDGPGMAFSDANGDSRAYLRVVEGAPSLSLFDKEGFETTIGTKRLVTPSTGETHKTSAASMVMFDKDKKVPWKAP